MNHLPYAIVITVQTAIIVGLWMRLSFYKSYYDQKQRNKKMMDEMRAAGASTEHIAAALHNQLK
jgi:hypothetical protein